MTTIPQAGMMYLTLIIFTAIYVLVCWAGWRILKRWFNNVVDHFEEDEEIARGHGL